MIRRYFWYFNKSTAPLERRAQESKKKGMALSTIIKMMSDEDYTYLLLDEFVRRYLQSVFLIVFFSLPFIKAGPLDLSFWSFFTFLYHGIEKVEMHLLWKFHENIPRKSWSNVPPKFLACIRFLYKVVHKIGRLRKFNRSREIEFNFFTAWTIFMKLGTLVHHVYGYKNTASDFLIFSRDLVMVFQSRKTG